MKVCSKCLLKKEDTAYSFRNKSKNLKHVMCKVCIKVLTVRAYKANKEQHKLKCYEWVVANRERSNDIKRKYTEQNYERHCALTKHNSAKSRAVVFCECCSRDEIIKFYEECPREYHVDHIIPLIREGPHCLMNMQYLFRNDHYRKTGLEFRGPRVKELRYER